MAKEYTEIVANLLKVRQWVGMQMQSKIVNGELLNNKTVEQYIQDAVDELKVGD